MLICAFFQKLVNFSKKAPMKISLEVDEEQHRYIKAAAALDGQSIKDFILSRIFAKGLGRGGAPEHLKVGSAADIRSKIEEAMNSEVLDGATAMKELREELRVKHGV